MKMSFLKFGILVVEGLHTRRITPDGERLLDNCIPSKNDSHELATLAQGHTVNRLATALLAPHRSTECYAEGSF